MQILSRFNFNLRFVKLVVFLSGFCPLLLVFAQNTEAPEAKKTLTDTGLWFEVGVSQPVGEKWSVDVSEELRFDKGGQHLRSAYTYAGIAYKLADFVSLQAGYRLKVRKTEHLQNEIRFGPTFKTRVKPLKLDLRLRVLYKHEFAKPDDAADSKHLRAALTARVSRKKWTAAPYVRTEWLYALSYKGQFFDESRWQIGVQYEPFKNHSFAAYYQYTANLNDSPLERKHILGFEYGYELPNLVTKPPKTKP